MKQVALLLMLLLMNSQHLAAAAWQFVDVTKQAGFNYRHDLKPIKIVDGHYGELDKFIFSGGVAVGDYDSDGWVDLYVVRGNIGPNLLFRNLGNGTFAEVSRSAGLASTEEGIGSGPIFADYTGDGFLDLFVGGVSTTTPQLFRNRGDGTFENITPEYGISDLNNSYSAAFGDYDRDGDLDLYVSHWLNSYNFNRGYLFENDGKGGFKDATIGAGLGHLIESDLTPNFADVNNDGWPDLLVAADFKDTKLFINNQDGTFRDATDAAVFTDENGMGAAVGDYDNDGDLDWFVTSIWDSVKAEPNSKRTWASSGNRLYRNRGDGTFEDATDVAGVRKGYWGWGSCFADFNNDGHLDIFHVTGYMMPNPEFKQFRPEKYHDDPVRLFISNGDGTFSEQSQALGLDDTGQGRGVSCFDYDRDGDLDIFISNLSGPPRLYRNDGGNKLHYLGVSLKGKSPNTEAIGARVYVTVNDVTQMRELRAGSNYESQNPVAVHFGLADATRVDELRIVWPDGKINIMHDVAVDQVKYYKQ